MSVDAVNAAGRPASGLGQSSGSNHRIIIILFSCAIVLVGIGLLLYGWDYYFLALSERPLSPKHIQLKPSGVIGLRLGISGFVLFAMVFLYPLRKHWSFLGRFGKTRNWFDYHVMLGLSAPVLITFHSAFKLNGFAGMAYWTMLALVASGIVGRYFYAQIPRSIGTAEMSLKEMQELRAELLNELKSQTSLRLSAVEELFRLPDSREIQSLPLYKILGRMVRLDLMRPIQIWSLRRCGMTASGVFPWFGGVLRTGNSDLEKAILIASRQAVLSKRILFLSQTHQIFHGWHVIHRPFSISFAAFVIIHVAVVTWLGYY